MAEFNILDPMGLFTGAQLTGVPAETLGEFPDELAEPTEEMLSRPDVLEDILGDDEILDELEAEDPDVLDNILDMIEEDEEGVLGVEADDDETEYLEEMLSILEDEAPEELDALETEFPDALGDTDTLRGARSRRMSRRIRRRVKSARRRVSRSVRRRVRKVKKVSRRAVSRARAATRRRIKKIRRVPRRVGAYVRTKARRAKTRVRAKVARYVAKRAGIPTPPAVPGMPAMPGMPAVPGMPAMPTPPAGMPAIPGMPAGMPAMPTPPKMPVVKFPLPLPPGMELRDVPAPPGAPKVQVPVPAGTPKLPEPPAMPGAPKLGDEDGYANEDEYLEETLDLPEVPETLADEERVARGMLAGKEVSHEGIPIETLITEKPVVTEAAELLAEPPEEELLGMGLI